VSMRHGAAIYHAAVVKVRDLGDMTEAMRPRTLCERGWRPPRGK
jgi:hypothetical protein